MQRINKVIPNTLVTDVFKRTLKKLQDRISQIIVNDGQDGKEILMTSIHNFYRYANGEMTLYKRIV